MTQPIDLFFRVTPRDPIREGIAIACYRRWSSDPLVKVHTIGMSSVPLGRYYGQVEAFLPEDNFHFESRRYASEYTDTEPYFLVDDDQMPLGAEWVNHALNLWHLYNGDHDYVMMVARPMLTCEDTVRHHDRLRKSTLPVEDMPYWWGSPYLSYKGAVPYGEFKGRADQQDPIVQDWAKREGKKQGLMMGVYYNHFGLSFSQVQPALYGRF